MFTESEQKALVTMCSLAAYDPMRTMLAIKEMFDKLHPRDQEMMKLVLKLKKGD